MMVLICGIPNAGKTTYSNKFDTVVHLDDYYRNYIRCNQIVASIEGDVCVEGLYDLAKHRKLLLDMCKHQEKKVCIWLDTPFEVCIEREKSYRKRSLNVVKKHHKLFEPPTMSEGWDEIIII